MKNMVNVRCEKKSYEKVKAQTVMSHVQGKLVV